MTSFAEEAAEKTLWPPILKQRLLTLCKPSPVFGVDLGFIQHLTQKLNLALKPLDILVVFCGGRLRNGCLEESRFWVVRCGEWKSAVKF